MVDVYSCRIVPQDILVAVEVEKETTTVGSGKDGRTVPISSPLKNTPNYQRDNKKVAFVESPNARCVCVCVCSSMYGHMRVHYVCIVHTCVRTYVWNVCLIMYMYIRTYICSSENPLCVLLVYYSQIYAHTHRDS